MKAFLSAGVAATTLLLASGAFAADLPSRHPPMMPLYTPPPIFTWTGFYVGANGGVGFGSYNNDGDARFGSTTGGMVGGTAGYNLQYGHYVFGVEADLDWAHVSGSGSIAVGQRSVSGTGNIDAFGTVRGRVGYAIDRTLIFATAGYAGADLNAKISDSVGNSFSQSRYVDGWVIGGGVEYAVTNNISVKGEYLYSQLGKSNFFSGGLYPFRSGAEVNTVRVGLNYHF